MKIRIHYVLLAILIQIVFSHPSFASPDSSESRSHKLRVFVSSGLSAGDNDSLYGMSTGFGLSFETDNRRIYTVKSELVVPFDNAFNGLTGREVTSFSEAALLYGYKWKWFSLSAGIGAIWGSVYIDTAETSGIKIRLDATGIATNVVWYTPLKWLSYELSANINSFSNLYVFGGRLSF